MRLKIMHSVEMKTPPMLIENPSRNNISYPVKVVTLDPAKFFQNIVKDLKEQNKSLNRQLYLPSGHQGHLKKGGGLLLYGFFRGTWG